MKVVKEEIDKAEGTPGGFWYSAMEGSKDAADFHVNTTFANFAAMDVERDNVMTIYEKAHGKEKRDEIQAAFREVTDAEWSYLYRRDADLSHNPPAE